MFTRKPDWSFLLLAALFLGLTTIATIPAAAQDPDWHHLRGTYFSTGETSCVISSTGFNQNLTPATGATVYFQTVAFQGTWKFHADGTVTGENTELLLSLPPSGFAGAGSDDNSFTGTYTVADDGVVTVEVGLVTGTMTTGPLTGLNLSVTPPPLSGRIARDRTAITLTSTIPTLETVTLTTPAGATVAVVPRICYRVRTLIPIWEH